MTLGALARETSRIRLGTLVNAATFRLPGPLAIAVAQVDEMSGGRVELGLGTGWFGLEHRSYGIPFPDVRERFEPRGAALAARFADEYNVGFNRAETAAIFGRVREAAAETGRELVYSVAQPICVGRDEAELQRRAAAIGQDLSQLRETGIAGAPAEVVERIGEYAELGAARVTCSFSTWPTSIISSSSRPTSWPSCSDRIKPAGYPGGRPTWRARRSPPPRRR